MDDAIEHGLAAGHFDDRAIEIRIAHAIPQMRLRDGHAAGRVRGALAVDACVDPRVCDGFSLRVQDLRLHFDFLLHRIITSQPGDDVHIRAIAIHQRLPQINARRSIIQRRDAQRVQHQQMHVAIESAEDGEIAGEWRNILDAGVVHAHSESVVSRMHEVGNVKTERLKSATMLAGG